MWIGAEANWGLKSVNETWRELYELQKDITPYITGEDNGEKRK